MTTAQVVEYIRDQQARGILLDLRVGDTLLIPTEPAKWNVVATIVPEPFEYVIYTPEVAEALSA